MQFVKKGEPPYEKDVNDFKQLASKCGGDYKTLAGLESIRVNAGKSE